MNSTTDDLLDEVAAKAAEGRVALTAPKAIALAGRLYTEGRYAQAESVCRQIIGHNPGQADAHNVLGVSLNAQGKRKEAVSILKRAVKLAPQASSIHANLGEIERQRGNLVDARAALRRAVEINPDNAQALNNLGIVHFENRDYAEALDCYRRALAIDASFAEAHNNLGNALRVAGDVDGAVRAYHDALLYRERYPEAYNNLGTLLKEQKQFAVAEHALRKAIDQNANYVEAYVNLAVLYFSQDQDNEALRTLGDALRIAPRDPSALVLTARIQLRRANYKPAEQACRIVIADKPAHAEALTVLGQLLHETDRHPEALGVLEKALAAEPKSAEARNFYGIALKSSGRLDEAREQIMIALQHNDMMYGAYANLNDLVDFAVEGELFDKIEAIMEAAADRETDQLLPLHFAYAKALDDRGEHGRALEHYKIGGRLKRAQLRYSEAETFGFFSAIKEAFPAGFFEKRPFKGNADDRPLFIVGMPRSGSTLVEQIISSHPDIFGAGEVKYLSLSIATVRDRFPMLPHYPALLKELQAPQFEFVAKTYLNLLTDQAGDARRITDKLLTNYFFVGFIHLLFPNAKIIHAKRNPVDTCLSAFTKLFKDDMPHSYDLGEIGRYYREYDELMAHWEQVLPAGVMKTVRYEDVVADTSGKARELIEFVGLPWNEACVDFHKSSRPVKTASVAQVRKPIYTTAVERWKKYGPGLDPLLESLGIAREEAAAADAPKAKRSRRASATL